MARTQIIDLCSYFVLLRYFYGEAAMGMDQIRAEIALRRLIDRQRKELLLLEQSIMASEPAKALLQQMLNKIKRLCLGRHPPNAELSKPQGSVSCGPD